MCSYEVAYVNFSSESVHFQPEFSTSGLSSRIIALNTISGGYRMTFRSTVGVTIKWLVIVGGLLSSSVLMASNVSFLRYSIISDFTEADVKQLQAEYLFTLNSKKPGEVHAWSNKESGNGAEVTIIKRYKQAENQCKRLKIKTHSAKQSAVSYFNFCLFGDDWKVVN